MNHGKLIRWEKGKDEDIIKKKNDEKYCCSCCTCCFKKKGKKSKKGKLNVE